MTDWIFQGGRKDFDIDNYLNDYDYIYWAVVHEQHQKMMSLGDRVFFWRTKGDFKDPYGLVGYGVIVEEPTHKSKIKYPEYLQSALWKSSEKSEIKVGVKVSEVRLDIESGLVESSLLLRDDLLNKMQLLTARQGSNFVLSDERSKRVFSLWSGEVGDVEFDDFEADETRIRTRIHKVRERDPKLVKEAKSRFIKKHGFLFCESCGFKFSDHYDFDYAEAHHKKPLGKLKAGEKTKSSDLAILCANCHIAVHRIESKDPWTELLRIHGKL
ncbi:HNH endonuclease [Vibrio splendidus]|uniref:HNH endonuclease n=1 Tax=Vibrio splendidus TaxID=29497 RepID=UPI00148B85C5|nr:HNH endonuclease [Vibrio splendidus]